MERRPFPSCYLSTCSKTSVFSFSKACSPCPLLLWQADFLLNTGLLAEPSRSSADAQKSAGRHPFHQLTGVCAHCHWGQTMAIHQTLLSPGFCFSVDFGRRVYFSGHRKEGEEHVLSASIVTMVLSVYPWRQHLPPGVPSIRQLR